MDSACHGPWFLSGSPKGNGHCVNSGEWRNGENAGGWRTGKGKADKVRQELNEKPLNHLWQCGSAHQMSLLRFPARLKVMKCAKKTPVPCHRAERRRDRRRRGGRGQPVD